MPKNLQDSVVVITGASSGIGRAAALAFARKGANVVVAARRATLLEDLATECVQESGREALAVPTDVTDEASVRDLARLAYETFGRIDVWINNAGVGAFARFEDTPADVYRGIIETNFFGETYGARAVLPYFREQGYGTLINNASLLAATGGAYYSAYSASKFAIRSLSETLRQEIEVLDHSKIRICTVMPASIDTPFFRHAANFTGRALKPLPPVYPAEQVAKTFVRLAERPKREVFVGNAGRMFSFLHTIAPPLTEAMMAQQINKGDFKPEPAPPTTGDLFEPMSVGTGISGGWKGKERTSARNIATLGIAVLAPALIAGVWWWERGRDGASPSLNGIGKQLVEGLENLVPGR